MTTVLRATNQPVERRGSTMAVAWLVVLILSVALSPRIRLPFLPERAIDLRIQDLLLIPIGFYALVAPHRRAWEPRRFWTLVVAFFMVAAAVTLLHELLGVEQSLAVRVAFLARGLEPFVLAALVCRLVVAGGPRASQWVLRALWIGVGANLLWVAFQRVTGRVGTLLGAEVGSLVESYGPKLIGEPSAFGAGAFWASAAALVIAQYCSRPRGGVVTGALLAAATLAAYEAQSRIWLGAIAVMAAVMVLRPGGRSRPLRIVLCATAGTLAALVVLPQLPQTGRLSSAGIDASAQRRTDFIWGPLLDAWSGSPETLLFGLGPGGVSSTGLTEAHNIVLRAVLDYGPVGAMLLLAIGFTAYATSRATERDLTQPQPVRMWASFSKLSLIGLAVAGLVQDSFTAVTSSHLTALAVGLYAGMRMVYRPPVNLPGATK